MSDNNIEQVKQVKKKLSGADILKLKRNNQNIAKNDFKESNSSKIGSTNNTNSSKSTRKAQRKG